MREIRAQITGLKEPILGKVITKSIFFKKDTVIVDESASKPRRGYLLTITANPDAIGKEGLLICSRQDLLSLKDGDIVQIEPSGRTVLAFEKELFSNILALTERCNQRCVMCPQPPVAHEESRLAFNLKLISLMDKDTKALGITGGEPTVVFDDLIMILKTIKKRLPDTPVTLLTNAVKLADKEKAAQIAAVGIKDLQVDIPLFGATPERHNEIVGAKTFYKTIRGIINLAECGINVGIRVVVHKMTYRYLSEIAYFIYHNMPFVSQTAFMQMETIGLARENAEMLWIDPYEYRQELADAVHFLNMRGITALIYNAQLCTLTPDVREFAVKSISEWKNISLTECNNCTKRNECPGFFASQSDMHSSRIKAFTD